LSGRAGEGKSVGGRGVQPAMIPTAANASLEKRRIR
jgi:hypothetical protein